MRVVMPRRRSVRVGDVGPQDVYGERRRLEESVRASRVAVAQVEASAPVAAPPLRGPLVGLDEPTRRVDEPVTAGLPVGPGPGPEALSLQPLDAVTRLRR